MDAPRKGRDGGLTALLIAPDRALAAGLTQTLAETRAFQILADLKTYPARNTLEIRLRQLKPELVLIDVASDLAVASELIRFIASWRPVVQVVGLHRSNDSAVVVTVLRMGASEFLYAPFDAAMQREAVARLKRLRQPDSEAAVEQGKVILFTSAKPGAGSSTLAVQMAHSMRRLTGKRVLLADLDLEGGTIAFYLKLQSPYSVVDAFEQSDRFDTGVWGGLVGTAEGLDVLAAPDHPHTDPVNPNRLHEVLEYARMLYDWVIVDGPSVFHRNCLLALAESDQAYLISTSDLASLHLTRKAIALMTQLGVGKDRYQIVVNRLSRRDGIAGSDIEKIFDCPIQGAIPNDYFSLHRVISLGQPLPPDCDLGRAIASLAAQVASPAAEKKNAEPAAEPRPAYAHR